MKLQHLHAGMTVYSVSRGKMGNTTISTVRVHPVVIKEVDEPGRRVLASWNYNPPLWNHEAKWSKWRKDRPVLIGTMMGSQRLATRAEIKAMKEKQP